LAISPCSRARSRAGSERSRGFWAAWVAQAISHLSWPSSRAINRVPFVVVVAVMDRSPSARRRAPYPTETCTTSDTSLPTWYRTTPLSSGGGSVSYEPRISYCPRGLLVCSFLHRREVRF